MKLQLLASAALVLLSAVPGAAEVSVSMHCNDGEYHHNIVDRNTRTHIILYVFILSLYYIIVVYCLY